MIDCDLVIFDCDGVLIDSEVLSCGCLTEVLGEHGIPLTIDQVFDRFLGRSFAEVARFYHAQTGGELPQAFRDRLAALHVERFSAALSPIPDVEAVLADLDRPFCLASSSDPARIELSLSVTNLKRFFEGRIFNAAMVERSKPAPDLFLMAAEKMTTRPARTIVIEDSVNGVLAGKAAGMTVWGFVGGSHYRERPGADMLKAAGADRIFSAMADFGLTRVAP
jgi:HAD superfamily hydrolase (TIGR01509 family)